MPAGGGYEAFLTSTVLAIESRLTEKLSQFGDAIFTPPPDDETVNSRLEEAEMESAYKVVNRSTSNHSIKLWVTACSLSVCMKMLIKALF